MEMTKEEIEKIAEDNQVSGMKKALNDPGFIKNVAEAMGGTLKEAVDKATNDMQVQIAEQTNHLGNLSKSEDFKQMDAMKLINIAGKAFFQRKSGNKDLKTIAGNIKDKTKCLEAEYFEKQLIEKGEDLIFATDAEHGGFIFGDNLLNDQLIPYLNSKSILKDKLNTVQVTQQSMDLPKEMGSPVITWNGEVDKRSTSTIPYDKLKYKLHEAGVILPISNQILADGGTGFTSGITRNALNKLAATVDYATMYGTGLENQPLGLKPFLTSENPDNILTSGGYAMAKINKDVEAALNAMEDANIDMDSLFWAMHTRAKNALMTRSRESTREAFAEIIQGLWFGIPYGATTHIDLDPSTKKSDIFLVNTSNVLLVERGTAKVKFFENMTYKDGNGDVVYGAQRGISAWMLAYDMDIVPLYKNAAAVIEDVNYSAT